MESSNNRQPCRLYREPERGEHFIVFGDPAEVNDYCAAVALSKKHMDFPLIYNAIEESSQFGYSLFYICKLLYNKTGIYPKLAVERNTGQATIYVLKTLNYPDLFRMVDFSATATTEGGGIGWVTTGHWSGGELQGTRRKMLDDLALGIKQGIFTFYDEEQLRQLMSFRYVKGRGQQMANKKDDLLIASSGSWQVAQLTPTMTLEDLEGNVDALRSNREKWRFR